MITHHDKVAFILKRMVPHIKINKYDILTEENERTHMIISM